MNEKKFTRVWVIGFVMIAIITGMITSLFLRDNVNIVIITIITSILCIFLLLDKLDDALRSTDKDTLFAISIYDENKLVPYAVTRCIDGVNLIVKQIEEKLEIKFDSTHLLRNDNVYIITSQTKYGVVIEYIPSKYQSHIFSTKLDKELNIK